MGEHGTRFIPSDYAGLEPTISKATTHLGGNIKFGDPFTYCPSVWDYMISRFCVQSVLDLGSGTGYASDYFHRKGVKVVAIDGLQENIDKSIYPTIKHDLTASPIYTRVDLVHCQEVVEHVEETYLDNLISSMLSGKIILMTHGLPGQFGHHHVNLQTADYWIDCMTRTGCSLLSEDTARVRMLAEKDGSPYMKDTGLVFANYTLY